MGSSVSAIAHKTGHEDSFTGFADLERKFSAGKALGKSNHDLFEEFMETRLEKPLDTFQASAGLSCVASELGNEQNNSKYSRIQPSSSLILAETSGRQAFRHRCVDASELNQESRTTSAPPLSSLDTTVYPLIASAMRQFFYASASTFDSMHEIVQSLRKIILEKGDVLMKQGEIGNDMFVVETGNLKVFRNNQEVDEVRDGDVVGELALIYNEARTATIMATSQCVLWSLHRDRFQMLQARQVVETRAMIGQYLREAECLNKLNDYCKHRLVSAMKRKEFSDGEFLAEEGKPTDSCYLVEIGSVAVTSHVHSAEELRHMFPFHSTLNKESGILFGTPGCFLGRPFLLGAAGLEEPIQASQDRSSGVIAGLSLKATGNIKCWYFTLEQFREILGPIDVALTAGVQGWFGSDKQVPVRSSENMTIADFRQISFLGRGGFGHVILAQCVKNGSPERGKKFAIKCMSKQQISCGKHVHHIRDERRLLEMMDHPFVLGLLTTFQDKDSLFLVTNYIQAISMWEVIYSGSVELPVDGDRSSLCRFWSANIVEPIRYLHSRGIAYRDLKPENILLDQDGYLLLIDLGFAKELPYYDDDGVYQDRTYTLCGTIEYLAPEFFFDGHGHDHAVDYWALGCLIYEFVQGQTPFVSFPGDQDYRNILKRICLMRWETLEFPAEFEIRAGIDSEGCTSGCADLILRLIEPDVSKRLGHLAGGVDDIMKHKYFNGFDWDALYARTSTPSLIPPCSLLERQRPTEHASIQPYTGDGLEFSEW